MNEQDQKLFIKTNFVKVGEKGKHLTIPEGWHLVTSGLVKKNDKYAHVEKHCWYPVEEDFDVGHPAEWIDFLIREN